MPTFFMIHTFKTSPDIWIVLNLMHQIKSHKKQTLFLHFCSNFYFTYTATLSKTSHIPHLNIQNVKQYLNQAEKATSQPNVSKRYGALLFVKWNIIPLSIQNVLKPLEKRSTRRHPSPIPFDTYLQSSQNDRQTKKLKKSSRAFQQIRINYLHTQKNCYYILVTPYIRG